MVDALGVQKIGLAGRAGALAAITRLTTAAAAGHGGALAVTGAPGEGRTALLDAVPGTLPAGWTVRRSGHSPATPPTIYLIDDAHLLDPGSWRRHRLADSHIALILSFPAGLEPAGIPVHRLAPLTPEAARRLLDPDLADEVAGWLIDLAGGNPGALLELAATMTPRQRRGYAPPPDCLPEGGPLHRRHIAGPNRLPDRTRTLIRLAAAAPGVAPDILVTASGEAGLPDFEAAERAGIVRVTAAGVRFAAELQRRAIYREMTLVQRRTAHLSIADALAAHGQPAEALLHRGAAATGPDRPLAQTLADTAQRSDPLFAAAARRQAAALTTDPGERAELLLAAARNLWSVGRPHEANLLIHEISAASDGGQIRRDRLGGARVRARGLNALMRLDEPGAPDVLLDVAAELADSDQESSLEMLAVAGEAVCRTGERGRFPELARRLTDDWRGHQDPAVALVRHHVAGLARIADGDEAGAFERLRLAVSLADLVSEPGPLLRGAVAGVLIGDGRRAAAFAARATATARERGAVVLVPQALELAALAAMASGDYAAAGASALDGVAVARETGQPALASAHLGVLAVLAALTGDRETALSRIGTVGDGPGRPLCEWALAVLDLLDGRGRPAAERLLAVLTGPPGPGSALLRVAVVPHLLEAIAQPRTPAIPEVGPAAEAFDGWAGRTGQPDWLALRDRCRALQAGDGWDAAAHFEAALGHGGQGGFSLAHTELLFGRLLRRRRRHVEARAHLRRAAETFQALDAGPWAAQSTRELRAAGARTEPATPATPALTAQQERIAALVADGATNREVAQELHLSPRTVDHHLRNVFTRLGVRSRTEMARLLKSG